MKFANTCMTYDVWRCIVENQVLHENQAPGTSLTFVSIIFQLYLQNQLTFIHAKSYKNYIQIIPLPIKNLPQTIHPNNMFLTNILAGCHPIDSS